MNHPHAVPRRILLLALMMNAASHGFFIISFPLLARTLGFTDPQAGMVMGLSALAMTFAAPVWGGICERYGRRKVFIAGLSLAMAFFTAAALVLYFRSLGLIGLTLCLSLVISFRVMATAGSAAVMPAAQAYMADITEPAQRTVGMGRLGAAFGSGSVLGSTIASVSGINFIWTGFTLCALMVAMAALVCWRCLPEPARPAGSRCAKRPGEWRRIAVFLLITLLGLAVYSLVQQVATLRLQDSFHYDAHDALQLGAAAMTAAMLLMIVTQLLVLPRLPLKPQQSLVLGALICLICLLLSLAGQLYTFITALVLLGVGLGLLFPANLGLLSLSSSSAAQARNAGINGLAQGIGLALGPLLGANLQALSYFAPWLTAALLMALIVVLALRLLTRLPVADSSRLQPSEPGR